MLLPVSQNFKTYTNSCFIVFYLTAFYLLTFAVNKLPIIVYATWSGLGIFTIATFDIYFLNKL